MPAKSHGRSYDPIYNVWQRMIARCYGTYCTSYPRYGGRGIKVCDRWRNSFEAFLADMGERPSGTELDRIDNDGDYEPSNCRWVTRSQNSRNRSSSRFLTMNGVTLTVIEWAERLGLKAQAIYTRLYRGKSDAEALATGSACVPRPGA